MAIVGFEQDEHPDAPPGAGYAIADSGERAYVYDPNLAAQFQGPSPAAPPMQAPEPPSYDLMSAADAGLDQQDDRLAFNTGPAGRDFNSQNLAVDAGGPPAPPPSASDVRPQMSGGPTAQSSANVSYPGDIANASSTGPNQSVQPPQASQGPPPEVDPDEQLRAQLQAGVNAPVYQAPVKGGLRPKSAEVTSEGAEAPMEAADWRELQDANEAIAQTQVTKAAVLRAQAENQIAQAQAQMPALQQEYEANKAQLDRARASAKQDLAKVQGLLQEVNTKKIDHHRLFLHSGFVGGMFAGIAQALGAGAAILGRTGHNVVKEQMDADLANDIAEQREEIENGRANANNALQMLRDRYNFDIPQAESALKIAQLGVQNAQLQQFQGMKMSDDAQMGLEQWIAQNQKDQFLEARKLYTASMGKQTRKESLTYQQGSAGGYRAPTDAERSRRLANIKAAQEAGIIQKPGEGKEQIDPQLVVYDTNGKAIAARNKESADKIRDKYEQYKTIMPSIGAMKSSAGHFNTLSPEERATFALNFETAVSTYNTSLGQGQMKDADMERWHNMISQGNFGAQRALAEFEKLVQNKYQAAVDSQTGPEVHEDFSRGKPKAGYNKKRAATPTVGRSQSNSDASVDDLRQYLKTEYGGPQ